MNAKRGPIAGTGGKPDRSPRQSPHEPREGRPELSVVIPMFEEEANVEPLHRELTRALASITPDYEILIIDDGSRDETLERLLPLCERDPRLNVLSLTRNYGQSAALQAGFDHARGQVIVTLDGDLQNDPADIGRLLKMLEEGFDVVSGWRRYRQEAYLTRRLPSKVANWLIGRILGTRIHDNGCTLKVYRRDVIKKARLYADLHRFLIPMLSLGGQRVTEVEIRHRPRRHGRSKYGLSRIWKVLLDLVAVKMLLRFASHPAAWFGVIAFPFFIAAILAGIGSFFAPAAPDAASDFPVVLPSIALLGAFSGAHLLLLGMLAELVARVGDHRESESVSVEVMSPDSRQRGS